MGVSVIVLPITQILFAQTTQDIKAPVPLPLSAKYVEATYYVVWSAAAAAGSVVVETAHDAGYTGTWANIGTSNWSAGSKESYISVSGIFGAVRVRISSAITSGTVDVYVIAANNT